jgi:general secretion pathway protein D
MIIDGKVIITADERTNKLIILSRLSNFPFFERIIAELDAKVDPDVTMKVIPLEYAAAEDAASLINSLISGGSPTSSRKSSSSSSSSSSTPNRPSISSTPPPPIATGGAGGTGTDTGFLQFAQGVRILPDARTNGLLIMATKEDMLRIEQLIRSIDTPVAQVLIEVVIAEVTLDNELDVGVDVFKRLYSEGSVSQVGGSSTDGNTPVQLPNAGTTSSSLLSTVPTAALLGSGAGGLTYFTTFRNLNLDVVLHALHSTSHSKVLSTPVIQTMDNQEASILVGESVPVPVSTVSSVVGTTGTLTANTALNANIDYKDVAIELKVTPRVNPAGYVRMDIEQKDNDLGPNVTISGTTVPEILKREAKSSVAVEDHSTIVMGGLIKETKTTTETKVPFLGDIPFLGQIFKSQQNSKVRDELIIFIRPTVMRDDLSAMREARRRAFLLKSAGDLQLEKQFENDAVVPPPAIIPKPAPAPKQVHPLPPPPVQGSVTPPVSPVPTSEEAERDAAKLKALEELSDQPALPPGK